jgi:Ca-activated chloride channel homolog
VHEPAAGRQANKAQRVFAQTFAVAVTLAAAIFLTALPAHAQNARLPRDRVLDHGVELVRDPATGELEARPPAAPAVNAPSSTPAIRARVELAQVGCTVIAPDGTQVRGLTRDDFRVFEDGVQQQIASFDAAATPASIALLLDDSPSIYRELGETREAARSLARSLQPDDEVAVAAFADQTHLLLPFSRDRNLLAAALASPTLKVVANSSQSFIYQAVYLTAHELFRDRAGRKAIVLLTDGQDSGLGLTWDPASMRARTGAASPLAFDDVARELASQGISLYVISTESRPKAMTDAWLVEHQREPVVTQAARRQGTPLYSLYLAEMLRQAGGDMYFLREMGGLAEVYRRIALALGAEYTLGYYPASGTAQPGWRQIDVQLRPGANTAVQSGARVAHRAAYYVSAGAP